MTARRKELALAPTQAHALANRRGGAWEGDARALRRALQARVRGEVRFDGGSRALYATDASNYRQVPIGVVIPRDTEDVLAALAVCREHGAPILARGGATSLAGQCCNVAVVIDASKHLRRVLAIDPDARTARVEPGVVLDELRAQAGEHGLTFGPDPATHTHCTLGGMIGNDSCGVHALWTGRTSANLEALEVATADGQVLALGPTSEAELERRIARGGREGELYGRLRALRDRHQLDIRARFPAIPRAVSGYALPALLPENGFHLARALAGSEGTCALTLEATVKLWPRPGGRALLVLGYPSVYEAGDHVPEVLEAGPIGLEGLDDYLVQSEQALGLHAEAIRALPEGGGWLYVELAGESAEEATEKAEALRRRLSRPGGPSGRVFADPAQQRALWKVREAGLGATARDPNPGAFDAWPGWEDSAVAPADVGRYLRDLRALYRKYGFKGALYGHFGDGCVHTRVSFDLRTRAGVEAFRAYLDEASDLVLAYGGSFSGEHGDGQARGELLPKMFGEDLVGAFREFKAAWDPEWRLNPGKLIDADPITANLRLGADLQLPEPVTHFAYPDDRHGFAVASLRCVGIGECRRIGGGVMCPSYFVTREERHSTRGRARLLFEMLHGEVIQDGWRSEAVHEALDLCLACKGCKRDCPVSVDMATYKAEFYAHHYAGRLRPRAAYALGLIPWWARLASLAPGLANAALTAPGLRALAKRLAGIAPERELPTFAPETFWRWFRRTRGRERMGFGRANGRARRPPVVLWPDTFNGYFVPETARAATSVLERAGFEVRIPARVLCCGRPLYDFGFLDLAKRLLREALDALAPEIAAGVPIVGLEPSCVAVFRDELTNLYPHDLDAQRLSRQFFTLAELLERELGEGWLPGRLEGRALVHGHCHQHAVMGHEPDERLLRRLGLELSRPEPGCCGMAGSFGYEAGEKHRVSLAIAERQLLPAARAADPDTLLIADGFSCRSQLREGTGRMPLHLAEALWCAMHGSDRALLDLSSVPSVGSVLNPLGGDGSGGNDSARKRAPAADFRADFGVRRLLASPPRSVG